MNQNETLSLWRECEVARDCALGEGKGEKEAHQAAAEKWNAWARDQLERREFLERTNKWAAEYCTAFPWSAHDWYAHREVGQNQDTINWLNSARVDFSSLKFVPKDAEDLNISVDRDVSRRLNIVESRTVIDFSYFIFPSIVDFHYSEFTGHVLFKNVAFYDTAGFRRSTFRGFVNFENSVFYRSAWFSRVNFEEAGMFFAVTFKELARFAAVRFAHDAVFEKTCFESDAFFFQNVFDQRAVFEDATFAGNVSFHGSKSEGIFGLSRAVFKYMPAFSQIDFKQAPDLDSVIFPRPSFWGRGEIELIARYRSMRRLAIQGHDYDREQMAFVGELRSRRWTTDKWYQPALWFSLAYDAVSDCGRSIARPFMAWFISIAVFAAFYWWSAGLKTVCASSSDHPVGEALLLSLKNAFVGLSTSRDPRFITAYDCLYSASNGPGEIPLIVTLAEILVQIPISVSLIFLFLLAIRNRFKIK